MIKLMYDRQAGQCSIEFFGPGSIVSETTECLAITDMVIDWVRKHNPHGLEKFSKTVIRQLTYAMKEIDYAQKE